MTTFEKKLSTLRTALLYKKFYQATRALEFAIRYHTGVRKDGVTPEFDHQVSMALYALTLPEVIDPEALIATILLHDVPEDYDVSQGEIRAIFTNDAFAAKVVRSVDCLTKKFRGVARDEDLLFEMMAEDAQASLVKPIDRSYNFQTMMGVFVVDKQVSYIDYCEARIFPMTKKARGIFPEQRMSYENTKHLLVTQIELIRVVHKAMGAA